MVFLYYEVAFNDELVLCLKSAIKNPSKKQVAKFLYKDMDSFGYTIDDIDYVKEISYDEAIIYYEMKEEKRIPVLGIDEFVY